MNIKKRGMWLGLATVAIAAALWCGPQSAQADGFAYFGPRGGISIGFGSPGYGYGPAYGVYSGPVIYQGGYRNYNRGYGSGYGYPNYYRGSYGGSYGGYNRHHHHHGYCR